MDEDIRAHLERQLWDRAFALIVERYQTKVFHLAVSILEDREQAQDAMQEALIRIWKALPGYRGASSVSTWVFAVARNTALTLRRSAAARRTVPLEGLSIASPGGSPSESPHAPDLRHWVAQLPGKQRQVVTLFYLEEKSYEDVARLLEMPMGTVKTLLHRARKELALRWRKETADAARHV